MKTTYDLYREIKRLDTGIPDDRIWFIIDNTIEDFYNISPEDRAPVAEEFLPDDLYDDIMISFIERKKANEAQKKMLKELEEKEAEKLEREMENGRR